MSDIKTLLDDDLTEEEAVEGFAVMECLLSGRCEACSHKPICETDSATPPQDTPCMKLKKRMMAADGGGRP